jgi:lipoprotein-anchoring transpeptidase ErfK/SrfK
VRWAHLVQALVAVVVAGVAVPALATRGSSTCDGIAAPAVAGSTIAKVVVPADVSATPGGVPLWRAGTSTPWGDNPTWLLVLGCRRDGQSRRWLRVRLPLRPNGASGWIRGDFVLLARSPYWIEISIGRAEVVVRRGGMIVRHVRAVVGAPGTPTPTGLFAVYDPVPQPRPGGFVGPWVVHLTAHSDVLDDYGGGPGRVAIHGRAGASLQVPLGSAASHGCVRVDNDVVSWLARTVPAGTPVRVRR